MGRPACSCIMQGMNTESTAYLDRVFFSCWRRWLLERGCKEAIFLIQGMERSDRGLGIILCFRQRQDITANASHVREVAFGHQPSAIAL